MALIAELARHAHAVAERPLPDGVAAAARVHLTDTVGAVLSGYASLGERAPALADALGLAAGTADGAGDPELSAAARRTALIAGMLAHCWEADDLHRAAIVCPGTVILPAVLAVAPDVDRLTWSRFLPAYVAGYEVALAAALAARPAALLQHGWWPTSLFGPLGAAAAASVLLGRSVKQTGAAIALAAQHAGGSVAGHRTDSDGRYLLSGLAAERAVWSVLAAGAGWSGPVDILEDPRCPLHAVRPAAIGLGGYHLPATSIKAHAAAMHLQAAIDCVLALRAELAGRRAEIEALTCYLPAQLAGVVDRPAPFESPQYALASAQFALPVALIRGRVTPADYGDDLSCAETVRLSRRVRVVADEELSNAYPQAWGARLEVSIGGQRLVAAKREADIDAGRSPVTDAVEAKFRRAGGTVVGSELAAGIARSLLGCGPFDPLEALCEHVLPLVRRRSGVCMKMN